MQHIENIFLKDSPVFLAPMAGITDAPFRELVCSFGVSAVVSEMISSEALVRNSAKTQRRTINKDDRFLKIVQIVGGDPKNMAESATINEDLGADVIDINMGCPARKIVSNDSGSALMKNEELALRIVEAVVAAVKIPVTLKMRLGWDHESINCFSLAKKFEDAGVKMLTIHCRTRSQMYSGTANWSLLKKMKETVKIPYLCNGDIKSGLDAAVALRESAASGVMVGRAALGKPWLLRQIMDFLTDRAETPPPTLQEQYKIIMNHFQNTLDFYGENNGIRIFRKHFCWYSGGMGGASTFRENINRSTDLSFIKAYVGDFFANKCYPLSQRIKNEYK